MYFEDKIRSLTPHHEKMTVLQRSQALAKFRTTPLPYGMRAGNGIKYIGEIK